MAALDICGKIQYRDWRMRNYRKKTGIPLQHVPSARRKGLAAPAVKTSTGRQVRSKSEKLCAEFLAANGIQFIYEPLLLLSGRQFRPDFYLPDSGTFIEICGFTHMPYYCDRMEEKRRIYAAQGLVVHFIEVRSGKPLKSQLEELASALTKPVVNQ